MELILCTGDATFTRIVVHNSHNNDVGAVENRRVVKRTHFQHICSSNVWAGVVDGMLNGSYFFPLLLTGKIYLDFY